MLALQQGVLQCIKMSLHVQRITIQEIHFIFISNMLNRIRHSFSLFLPMQIRGENQKQQNKKIKHKIYMDTHKKRSEKKLCLLNPSPFQQLLLITHYLFYFINFPLFPFIPLKRETIMKESLLLIFSHFLSDIKNVQVYLLCEPLH